MALGQVIVPEAPAARVHVTKLMWFMQTFHSAISKAARSRSDAHDANGAVRAHLAAARRQNGARERTFGGQRT